MRAAVSAVVRLSVCSWLASRKFDRMIVNDTWTSGCRAKDYRKYDHHRNFYHYIHYGYSKEQLYTIFLSFSFFHFLYTDQRSSKFHKILFCVAVLVQLVLKCLFVHPSVQYLISAQCTMCRRQQLIMTDTSIDSMHVIFYCQCCWLDT